MTSSERPTQRRTDTIFKTRNSCLYRSLANSSERTALAKDTLDLLAVEVRRNKGRTKSPQDYTFYMEVRTRAFSTDASVAVGEKQMQTVTVQSVVENL
jgi:hypothetical protein